MTAASSTCDFCGLPLPGPVWGRGVEREPQSAGDAPAYCCLGCRIAAGVTRERGQEGEARWLLVRLGLALFLTLNVLAFSMALWTRDVYSAEGAPEMAGPLEGLLRYLCLLFSLPVLWLLGVPLAENAWQALRRGAFSTDLLLVTGVAAAYVRSGISVLRDDGPIYFEVGCVILVMVTLGRWLEATGKLQAGAALDALQKLLPERVRRESDAGEESIPLEDVRLGDRLRVLPGERFPTDARLLGPALQADEQLITGESRPVFRQPGDLLRGGTLNLDADCRIEATALPAAGTLARLIALVRRARETKGEYQRLADRLAAGIFPLVALVALAAGAWHAHRGGLDRGILAGLSVVLVACPCALGLATPLAVWSALGLAARKQVLFRDGESLERLAGIRAIRFDKTGTLTTGRARVIRFLCDDESASETVRRGAAVLAGSSSHPFSTAIVDFAAGAVPGGPVRPVATDVRQLPGRGLAGTLFVESDPALGKDRREIRRVGQADRPCVLPALARTALPDCDPAGRSTVGAGPPSGLAPLRCFLGNRRWMADSGLALSPSLADAAGAAAAEGNPLSFIGWGGRVRGFFVFSEELRPAAAGTLAWCRDNGLDVAILTGDHRDRARALAEQWGVPVQAELLPEAKVAAIRSARERIGPVAMVGDGVNDAPALAASDVGIALGCGADVSRDSAGVCLLSDDPARLAWAISFARRALSTIRHNLLWAFAYNSAGIVLAAGGWLNPALAAGLMVASSLLVIGHALRLGTDEREPGPVPASDNCGFSARGRATTGSLPERDPNSPLPSLPAGVRA